MRLHRFEEIQPQTGATPQMIAARLKKLKAVGLVKRHILQQTPATPRVSSDGKKERPSIPCC